MNKIVLLCFTALTMHTMADDVVVAQDSQMITESASKPSCNTPPPRPPQTSFTRLQKALPSGACL